MLVSGVKNDRGKDLCVTIPSTKTGVPSGQFISYFDMIVY